MTPSERIKIEARVLAENYRDAVPVDQLYNEIIRLVNDAVRETMLTMHKVFEDDEVLMIAASEDPDDYAYRAALRE